MMDGRRLEDGRVLGRDIEKCEENRRKNFPTFLLIHQGSSNPLLWYAVGMGDLHVLEGRLNASGYIGVLEDKHVPFTDRVFVMGISHFNKTAHLVIQRVQIANFYTDTGIFSSLILGE